MLYRSTIKSTIFAILTASLACAQPSHPVTEQPALILKDKTENLEFYLQN